MRNEKFEAALNDPWVRKNLAIIDEMIAKKQAAEREAWACECAIRGLEENTSQNIIAKAGLHRAVVKTTAGTLMLAEKWNRDGLVTGRYINRRGEVSPTWTAGEYLDDLEIVGKWDEKAKRVVRP